MALEWYVKRGAERSGPISQREFEKLQEHLEQTDLLWRSDWQEWRPYSASPARGSDAGSSRLSPAGLLRHLVVRDLIDREIAPEKWGQYQYARVVRELVRSVAAGIASHPHWEHTLRARFAHCVSMVDELVDACNVGVWQREPQPDPRDVLTTIWRHVQFDASGASTEPFRLDGELLSDLAHSYLLQAARSREFENVLIDALAASAICHARRRKETSSRASLPGRLAALLGRRSRDVARSRPSLLKAMVDAYTSLKELDTDPDRCKRAFQTSAGEGAEWAAPMLAMLDLRVGEAREVRVRADRSRAGLSRL